ncbi:hypothetical protein V8F20_009305 [Naviculisporaceae sp. PSN 640]
MQDALEYGHGKFEAGLTISYFLAWFINDIYGGGQCLIFLECCWAAGVLSLFVPSLNFSFSLSNIQSLDGYYYHPLPLQRWCFEGF